MDNDYVLNTMPFAAATFDSASIAITLTVDGVLEDTECFELTLADPDGTGELDIFNCKTTICIKDVDTKGKLILSIKTIPPTYTLEFVSRCATAIHIRRENFTGLLF